MDPFWDAVVDLVDKWYSGDWWTIEHCFHELVFDESGRPVDLQFVESPLFPPCEKVMGCRK